MWGKEVGLANSQDHLPLRGMGSTITPTLSPHTSTDLDKDTNQFHVYPVQTSELPLCGALSGNRAKDTGMGKGAVKGEAIQPFSAMARWLGISLFGFYHRIPRLTLSRKFQNPHQQSASSKTESSYHNKSIESSISFSAETQEATLCLAGQGEATRAGTVSRDTHVRPWL